VLLLKCPTTSKAIKKVRAIKPSLQTSPQSSAIDSYASVDSKPPVLENMLSEEHLTKGENKHYEEEAKND
jgi:hypothetical protein